MDGVSEKIFAWAGQGPGFSLTIMAVLLVSGAAVLAFGWRVDHLPELGVGLIVGGLFALASYANQVTVQISDFRSSLAVSDNLTGFESNGYDLRGLNFAGKTLRAAELPGENLTGANFKYADLREANLRDALLHDTIFFYATFLRADLTDSEFIEADLQGAKITTTSVAGAKFTRAKVHGSTCWNVTMSDLAALTPDAAGSVVHDLVINSQLRTADGKTLGRVCERREVGSSIQDLAPTSEERVLICVNEPHLTRDECGD